MDDNIWSGQVGLIIANDASKKLPLGGRHGALNQMIFGINLVRHNETGVDDDGGFLQH